MSEQFTTIATTDNHSSCEVCPVGSFSLEKTIVLVKLGDNVCEISRSTIMSYSEVGQWCPLLREG